MTKKTFHLRWNNHLQNLQSLFENLYNEQSLVDVTISCSDGLLYGHKLVLSACSPYFEQVFKDNPCKHPIMILKGIKRHDMQVLLEYMYMGSVDVGEQDLEMLLETATELQIKGLVQYPEGSPHPSHKNLNADKTHYPFKDSRNIFTSKSPSPQLKSDDLMWQAELVAKPSTSKQQESNSMNQQLNSTRHNSTDEMVTSNKQNRLKSQLHEENEIEFEPVYPDHEADEAIVLKEEYQEVSEDESNNYSAMESLEESTEKIQVNYSNFIENKTPDGDDVNFFCHLCTRGFQNKGSYHRHMLTHAGVKPHHCTFCNQSFLRLSHLQRHIRVHTGERPYSCGQCPKQFARSDKLRQHYIIQHSAAATSKISKPRGRPRKNVGLLTPSSSPSNTSSVSSMYSVSINNISMNPVPPALPS